MNENTIRTHSMIVVLCILISLSPLTCAGGGPWNKETLSQPPNTYTASGFESEGLEALFYEGLLLTPALANALLAAALLGLGLQTRFPSWTLSAMAGLAVGGAVLLRASMLLLVPALGLAVFLLHRDRQSSRHRGRRILAGLVLVGGSAVVFMPFVLWLIRKDKSAFVDDHGREVVNLLISMVVFAATVITVVTIPFVIAWVITMVINLIRGAIAASNGQYFRYPMIIRFIS